MYVTSDTDYIIPFPSTGMSNGIWRGYNIWICGPCIAVSYDGGGGSWNYMKKEYNIETRSKQHIVDDLTQVYWRALHSHMYNSQVPVWLTNRLCATLFKVRLLKRQTKTKHKIKQGNSVARDFPPTGSEANTPSLPSYLANSKTYLVNDYPIYFKIWPKVKLYQFKSVQTLLKITWQPLGSHIWGITPILSVSIHVSV